MTKKPKPVKAWAIYEGSRIQASRYPYDADTNDPRAIYTRKKYAEEMCEDGETIIPILISPL